MMPDSPTSPPRPRRPMRSLGIGFAAFVLAGIVLMVAVVTDEDETPPAPSAVAERTPGTGQPRSTSAVPTKPGPPPDGVTPDPDSLLVLVDHDRSLPDGYVPGDLVLLDVDFTFEAIDPRRFLRQEASEALRELFVASEADGLPLLGISGFRSAATQAELFEDYVEADGLEAADRYSARPGHSEHQTGLAVDVVGLDAACPTVACFADRPEAAWLAEHAHEHGFIIRYPRDGEPSTGYLYEPWHLRYVGPKVAAEIHRNDETLEQHLGLP